MKRKDFEIMAPVGSYESLHAAIAAGADGLLVETHPNPSEAWCDADQALTPDELLALMTSVRAVAGAIGRSV